MYWLAPENFLLILSIILIVLGFVLGISILLIAGVVLFVGLILFTVLGMAARRKKLSKNQKKKD